MRALFLANLGTPDAPTEEKVRTYLRQFLLDPQVIDIPSVMRWLLVHGIILRTRPRASAEAYAKIWTERGSPLLFHLNDLARQVQTCLGDDWRVVEGMRYGNPSFREGVRKMLAAEVKEVLFFPLYPQYSDAATGSSLAEFRRAVAAEGFAGPVREVEWFYHRPEYLEAAAHVTGREFATLNADHVLFSFHGLPERHLLKSAGADGPCLSASTCCEGINPTNSRCYRAQCFATAHSLARELKLPADRYSVAFQSRLGRTPWIRPYTEDIYQELARRGVRRLAVACPSFVADCLETLEEIRIRGKERFLEHGGEELHLIPSLNSDPAWAEAIARIARGWSI